MDQEREQWGSKIGFILAAAGSAVGLGNIWKFPYLVGENGGASFILIYLICVLLVGLPVALAEVLIGRSGQKNPVGSFRILSQNSKSWTLVGILGVLTGFIILSYYNVIAGWSLGYVIESIKGSFATMTCCDDAQGLFNGLAGNPKWALTFLLLFNLLTLCIVYFGVTKGIEKAGKIMMPLLLVLIILLVIRGLTLEGASRGVKYLLKADFSAVNGHTILLALGQAFFSLSLGMGALLTYGSYMSKDDNLTTSTLSIVGLDTLIAILAGFMIFPALFAMNMEPDQGPALIYNILPIMFNGIPGGYFFRILFFLLLSLAALTSTISLLEVIVSFLVDEFALTRQKAVLYIGGVIFLLGIPSALGFGIWSNVKIFRLGFFDCLDYLASNIFLPLGGICIALFTGWKWGLKNVILNLREGIHIPNETLENIWIFILRFIAPVLILLIFLSSLGII